jgi:hypothetical protein
MSLNQKSDHNPNLFLTNVPETLKDCRMIGGFSLSPKTDFHHGTASWANRTKMCRLSKERCGDSPHLVHRWSMNQKKGTWGGAVEYESALSLPIHTCSGKISGVLEVAA